jgi:hypothetical protein
MHRRFAESHREFGAPRELPGCGGWIVERTIPGSDAKDAMGCYPLFACRDWSRLHADIEDLRSGLVSLALVADPFGDYDEAYLHRCFPDLVLPFKEHYVVDLTRPSQQVVSKHHRKYARKALRRVEVHVHPNPPDFLETWIALHDQLVAKHHITGIGAFSRSAFAEQLGTPGAVLQWASYQGEPVAAILYLEHGEVAYAHILGCSPVGYAQFALYGLLWCAIEHFRASAHWLDLMGVPGLADEGSEGIRQFKRGWTAETRMAWLCGSILDRPRYAELVEATGTAAATYFPAYRNP